MATPHLGAPELVSAQAVPETTVNEQIRYVEQGAGHFVFKDRSLVAQPGSPADGDCYLLTGSPTGAAWSTQANKIAFYMNTAWVFVTPKEGWGAYVADEDVFILYDGAAWNTVGGSVAELDDVGDVNAAAPSNGDVLTWDSTPGEWVAQALPGAGAFVLDDATDVDTTGVSDGDVLTYDSGGGEWIAAAPAGGGLQSVADVADNTITQTINVDNLYVADDAASAMNASAASSDNLTVSFTVGATTKVNLQFYAMIARATGLTRIRVMDTSGAQIWPKNGSLTGTVGQYSKAQGEGDAHTIQLDTVIEVASGTHTWVIKAEHSSTTPVVSWLDRSLRVVY